MPPARASAFTRSIQGARRAREDGCGEAIAALGKHLRALLIDVGQGTQRPKAKHT